MRNEVNVNANMLTWAIARAGYQLHEFIAKLPNVQQWIEGTKKPTVKQLEIFSKKVHLPFGYLFLPEPPKEKLPISLFRTNNTQATQVSVNMYDTILLMQQRQDWLIIVPEILGINLLPSLSQLVIYPNPFEESVTITFSSYKTSYVSIDVFNGLGIIVSTLYNDYVVAHQTYSINTNMHQLSTGVYYCRIRVDELQTITKFTKLRHTFGYPTNLGW